MEETLGNTLRAARKAAGISVDDAVYLAKIPRGVVQALEAEDFGFFSSPLYARSFLEQYGKYVGADVTPWLADLEPMVMIDGETVDSFVELSVPRAGWVGRKTSRYSGGGGAWAAVWMLVITGGLLWGGLKIFENFDRKNLAAEQEEALVAPAAKESTPLQPVKAEANEAIGAPPKPLPDTGPRRAIIVVEELVGESAHRSEGAD